MLSVTNEDTECSIQRIQNKKLYTQVQTGSSKVRRIK